MDYETLLTVQGYAKFFLILAVFIIFTLMLILYIKG